MNYETTLNGLSRGALDTPEATNFVRQTTAPDDCRSKTARNFMSMTHSASVWRKLTQLAWLFLPGLVILLSTSEVWHSLRQVTSGQNLFVHCPQHGINRQLCPLESATPVFSHSATPVMTLQDLLRSRERLESYVLSHQSMAMGRLKAGNCIPRIVSTTCHPGMLCGGLGDRMRGLIIGMLQSVLTDSIFVHDISKPVPLSAFFRDTIVDASMRRDLLSCQNYGKLKTWVTMDGKNLQDFDYQTEWANTSFVKVVTNTSPVTNIWNNTFMRSAIEARNLQRLPYAVVASVAIKLYHGKPAYGLIKNVEGTLRLLSDGDAYTVGIQIRTGMDPSFHDPPRHHLEAARAFADKAIQLCLDQARKCVFFLTTDHIEAQKIFARHLASYGEQHHQPEVRSYPYTTEYAKHDFQIEAREITLVYSQSVPTHLDKAIAADITDIKQTYLDWYLLAYHVNFILASSSGFSVAAIHANFTPHLMFVDRMGFVEPATCPTHHCRQVSGYF